MKTFCECDCENHHGELMEVNIRYLDYDWGTFTYCQAAIKEYKERGLDVLTVIPTRGGEG